ncbi:MAG: hypothetical protein E4G91_05105 [Candidatus Zixiibacteriota bacterium]|nr:MAG: hypothetical protein E4G91_05105 [candidate division Zixibacteria bacterium]
MPNRSRGLLSPLFLIAGSLALATAVTLPPIHYSNVGAAQLAVNDSSLTLSDTAATSQDSLYAGINRGFAACEPIFVKGCFDCHTDRTRFPWYHKLPVIRGMIDSDIRNAQKRLNMSSGFPFSKRGNVADDLVSIHDELKGGDMPPLSYRFMHWEAKPSQAEADSIYNWINLSLKALSAHCIEPTSPPEEGQ